MNILWIEDFGGGLDSGKATLNLMFQQLISFENWDEDELSLLSRPDDLEKYFKENTALQCVLLCRNYYDYLEFKTVNNLLGKVDAIIIDIRLHNNVDLNLPIPSNVHTNAKFHEEAGFYIFNDLVRLGFPAEMMCFMTGEMNSFSGFKKHCDEIYIPEVTGFEKSDTGYVKLRQWIEERGADYINLRRGVIEGCEFLKNHIKNDESNIQFRDFIKLENAQPTIEIPKTELNNYLDALSQFLALKEPHDKNIQYRLFLRTLVHEWEENIEAKMLTVKHPQYFTKDQPNFFGKMNDIYTFAWLMKMSRNWVSHAKLLEPLNAKFISFLFLINMRAMFRLPKAIQPYEKILLRCMSLSPVNGINSYILKDEIRRSEENVGDLLIRMDNIHTDQESNFILTYFDKKVEKTKKLKYFNDKINEIYRYNT